MTKLNKALMASTAIAFACGLALPASAQDPAAAPGVVSSGSKMKIKLYGQIARVFGIVDDGDGTTFKTGENGNTATRMGMDARGKINNDVSVRTRFEYAFSRVTPPAARSSRTRAAIRAASLCAIST